ncbi:MAG: hypothetical protein DHS20C01_07160 [marine bacterium B5-7]|nr:MAG: hypothetical protein DHS20C01_07160 [marine bacterium B5-7]
MLKLRFNRSIDIILTLVVIATVMVAMHRPAKSDESIINITLGGEPFVLELALDPASRSQGLMNRGEIAENGGMLFAFPDEKPRNFWMKNCLIDMDIIFLDANGTVVDVKEMFAEPLQRVDEPTAAYHARLRRYPSAAAAQFAIELRHGTTTRLDIRPGQTIDFDRQTLASRAR